jgi:hypothetical protein
MQKTVDSTAVLSSAAMMAKRAESYSPETYVIDLAELRQIIWDLQQKEEAAASPRP